MSAVTVLVADPSGRFARPLAPGDTPVDGAGAALGVSAAAAAVAGLAPIAASGSASDLSAGTAPTARLGGGSANASTFLRGDQTWAPPSATVALASAAVAFTDGDTVRRVTVADATVSAASKILLTVTRPTVTDPNDPGYLYDANVVSRGTGTFDVLLRCLDVGGLDCTLTPPSETVSLTYLVA